MYPARALCLLLLTVALSGLAADSGSNEIPARLGIHSDFPAPWLQSEADAEGLPEHTQRYSWLFPRVEADRPDERTGPLVHYLYLVPKDGVDQRLDELGVLEVSIRAQMNWLRQQDNVHFRIDTYSFAGGGPDVQMQAADITFVRSDKTVAELTDTFALRDELIARGFDDPQKKYITYVSGGDSSCGSAIVSLGGGGGEYAAVWLVTHPACRMQEFAEDPGAPSYPESTAVHEALHLLGAVQPGAPHFCLNGNIGHVCTPALHAVEDLDPEEVDVMFPYAGEKLADELLDRDRDDYYGHSWSHLDDVADSPWWEPAP